MFIFNMMYASSLLIWSVLALPVLSDIRRPHGKYTARNRTSSQVNADITFFGDGRLKYRLRVLDMDSSPAGSYPFDMVTSSIIKVTVDDAQHNFWKEHNPGGFDEEGLTTLGYDPILDRVTVISTGGAIELLHESDKLNAPGAVELEPPSGLYKAKDGDLKVKIHFTADGENIRASYQIRLKEVVYASPVSADVRMLSSSLLFIEVPASALHELRLMFPFLTPEWFYRTLGYNAADNEITFLLDQHRAVILKHREGRNAPKLPKKTVNNDLAKYRPYGEFCAYRGALRISVRFSGYTATVAAILPGDRHFIARNILFRYTNGVISLDVLNSDLYEQLRAENIRSLKTLDLKHDPDMNRLFLSTRGKNSYLFQRYGCAHEIENYKAMAEPEGPADGGATGEVSVPMITGEMWHDFIECFMEFFGLR
ncbi:hypothetical protein FOL47_001475 [Perkinsus chesapeaki]|uniref:Uncharacterized protein n=1 Tax=Perkinsus chesapeaki TaxID=330153 RepID=A0A7J6KU31_PERCH|nr:hypothetical protein FOL47_001475 [Perkinsus chesapeaki]